jgi:cell division protein FtsL
MNNNEARMPSRDAQEPNVNPEYSRTEIVEEPSSTGLKLAVLLLVLVAGIAVGYGWLQHNNAQQLASERADLRASLAQSKIEADALTARVNALSAAQAQEDAARAQEEAAKAQPVKNEQFPPRAAETPRRTKHALNGRRAPADDPRWKQVQQQLGDQQKALADSQKQIADTQANLDQAKAELEGNIQSARTDLGGDIARNHDELVVLQKKGERNYYEFSFEKSKTYHHTGPVSIALRKADSKHEYCDLDLVVDDKEMTRKHINLYESVSFYPQGYPLPLELVINHIDKDSVHGYVSEPKYRTPEQTASAAPAPTAASVNPAGSATADAKLEHRDDGAH